MTDIIIAALAGITSGLLLGVLAGIALSAKALAQADLDVTTEFLLIAATLVELKTRRLLPNTGDVDLDEELALWEERDLLLARGP